MSEAPNRREYPVADRTSMLRVPAGSGPRSSVSATPDQRFRLYHPDVQSSVHSTAVCRSAASRSAVKGVLTSLGVVSSSHAVGTGAARWSEPVVARGAPASRSKASLAATPAAAMPAARRKAARVRSPVRSRGGRLHTWAAATGTAASARPMCQPSAVSGPSVPTPIAWAMPRPIETVTRPPSRRPGAAAMPRRTVPRTAIRDFGRISASTARPTAPWAHTTSATRPSPMRRDRTPVAVAAPRTTASARFVRLVMLRRGWRARWRACRPRRRACRAGAAGRARTAAPRRPGSAGCVCTPSKAISTTSSGPDVDTYAVAAGLQLQQALGLPRKHRVGQPLERLAEHAEAAVRVARAEVQVREPALAAAVAPLRGEDDQIERVPRLHLEPAGAPSARPRTARSSAFTITPSWPRASASSRKAGGGAGVDDRARHAHRLGDERLEHGEALRRPDGRAGRRRRRGGRRRRAAVERHGARCARRRGGWRTGSPSPGTGAAARRREARSPRRRGRPRSTRSASAASTTSGTRAVTSSRLRVNTRTSPPRRCTWMRAPSSFHSIAAGEIRSSAAVDVRRRSRPASAATGRPTSSPIRRSPSAPRRAPSPPRRPGRRRASRPAHVGDRHGGRPRDRLGHDAGQRALAQVAQDQRDEEPLLRRGRAAEERARPPRDAPPAIPGPASVARRSSASSTSPDRERRLGGGGGRLAERRPARAGLTLARSPGEERDAGDRPRRARGRAGTPPGGRPWPCATRFRARIPRRRRAVRAACRGRVASPCRVPAP